MSDFVSEATQRDEAQILEALEEMADWYSVGYEAMLLSDAANLIRHLTTGSEEPK